ncbi:ribonuclease H2 subunit A-like [Oscarella lobularis]|uniref:ribonuclease H2 subunit A-like n=1 Tax=Oscarella lobularis TaxID=121494 RepID=UPI0033131CF0
MAAATLNFGDDNSVDRAIDSDVQGLSSLPCCAGIDEAGRGPVLGPMVYCLCYCPTRSLEGLKKLGFADSKQLTEEKRDRLFEIMQANEDFIGWNTKILSPNTISNAMLRRSKYNLNALSHDTAIDLVRTAVSKGVNITELYVDTVGPADKYQKKLSDLFPGIQVTVSQKADSKFSIVSAASICAKVTRDEALRRWRFSEGLSDDDFGSGYPSDPKTKSWLSKSTDPVFGFPQLVRFSWSTCEKIMERNCVPVHWDDDDDEADVGYSKGTAKLVDYFGAKSIEKSKRHRFFKESHLTSLNQI